MPVPHSPSHTTGAPSLNRSGGSPWCTTVTVSLPSVTRNVTPSRVSCTEPGTTSPARRKRSVPRRRAARPLPTPCGSTRRCSESTNASTTMATTATHHDGGRGDGAPPRPCGHREVSPPDAGQALRARAAGAARGWPCTPPSTTPVSEPAGDDVAGVGHREPPGRARVDELGAARPLGDRGLELALLAALLERREPVAPVEQVHVEEREREHADQERQRHRPVDLGVELGVEDRGLLVERPPPLDREVDDRHVDERDRARRSRSASPDAGPGMRRSAR